MTISQAAQKVLDGGAILIRPRKGHIKGQPIEYDVKDWNGNKRGWAWLDLQTANAIMTVYNALKEQNNPKLEKFDQIPLTKLVDFCWRMVKAG